MEKYGQQGIIYSPACGYHAVTTYKGFYTNKLKSSRFSQKDILSEALTALE